MIMYMIVYLSILSLAAYSLHSLMGSSFRALQFLGSVSTKDQLYDRISRISGMPTALKKSFQMTPIEEQLSKCLVKGGSADCIEGSSYGFVLRDITGQKLAGSSPAFPITYDDKGNVVELPPTQPFTGNPSPSSSKGYEVISFFEPYCQGESPCDQASHIRVTLEVRPKKNAEGLAVSAKRLSVVDISVQDILNTGETGCKSGQVMIGNDATGSAICMPSLNLTGTCETTVRSNDGTGKSETCSCSNNNLLVLLGWSQKDIKSGAVVADPNPNSLMRGAGFSGCEIFNQFSKGVFGMARVDSFPNSDIEVTCKFGCLLFGNYQESPPPCLGAVCDQERACIALSYPDSLADIDVTAYDIEGNSLTTVYDTAEPPNPKDVADACVAGFCNFCFLGTVDLKVTIKDERLYVFDGWNNDNYYYSEQTDLFPIKMRDSLPCNGIRNPGETFWSPENGNVPPFKKGNTCRLLSCDEPDCLFCKFEGFAVVIPKVLDCLGADKDLEPCFCEQPENAGDPECT